MEYGSYVAAWSAATDFILMCNHGYTEMLSVNNFKTAFKELYVKSTIKWCDEILHEVCVSSVQNWMVYINSNHLVIATKSKNDICLASQNGQ